MSDNVNSIISGRNYDIVTSIIAQLLTSRPFPDWPGSNDLLFYLIPGDGRLSGVVTGSGGTRQPLLRRLAALLVLSSRVVARCTGTRGATGGALAVAAVHLRGTRPIHAASVGVIL